MKRYTNWITENKDEIKHYVDGILVSPDDEILILQRANYMKQFRGLWGFAGGSIEEKDKSPKDAIIREIKEETGIELTFNEQHHMKSFDKQGHEREDGSIGSDTEYWLIKLETKPEIKLSREHQRYKWMAEDNFKEKQGKYMPDVFQEIQNYYLNK